MKSNHYTKPKYFLTARSKYWKLRETETAFCSTKYEGEHCTKGEEPRVCPLAAVLSVI